MNGYRNGAAQRIAPKLRATRPQGAVWLNDSSCAPAHNTPLPLERSPPASFKRLLGRSASENRLVKVASLRLNPYLVTVELVRKNGPMRNANGPRNSERFPGEGEMADAKRIRGATVNLEGAERELSRVRGGRKRTEPLLVEADVNAVGVYGQYLEDGESCLACLNCT